jgi:ubiquinone/menaquinone biosynthesis C-methylase UbiE
MSTPSQVRNAYDTVAQDYASRFSDELSRKPFDRLLLDQFAGMAKSQEGSGSPNLVADLGCGPGHTTAYLARNGLTMLGLDLSPALIAEAHARHPGLSFLEADMLHLPLPAAAASGAIAFYSIVHFSPAQLSQAFSEMHRILSPGAPLLLSFHIGDETVRVDDFLGKPASLDFHFLQPETVADMLEKAGFTAIEIMERAPYPDVEFPSRRAYVFATRP